MGQCCAGWVRIHVGQVETSSSRCGLAQLLQLRWLQSKYFSWLLL